MATLMLAAPLKELPLRGLLLDRRGQPGVGSLRWYCNDPPTALLTWAQRLKRVFEIDITLCPRCGGMLRVIGDVTNPELIRKNLDHVNSHAPPRLPPRRAESDTTYPDLFAERQ